MEVFKIVLEKAGEGAAVAIVSMILYYCTKSLWYRAFVELIPKDMDRLVRQKWHTAFVQNGEVRVEYVSSIKPFRVFGERYIGEIEYHHPVYGKNVRYAFEGRLQGSAILGLYRIEDKDQLDFGSWTLRLSDGGNIAVGGYAWMVQSGGIHYDHYQWSTLPFEELLRTQGSHIDGQGIVASIPLPVGALAGQLRGEPVPSPTRCSLKVRGQHVEPGQDCKLKYLNHSCSPNAEMRGGLLFMNKAIAAGDEVTIDYRNTEDAFHSNFVCSCQVCMLKSKELRTKFIGV